MQCKTADLCSGERKKKERKKKKEKESKEEYQNKTADSGVMTYRVNVLVSTLGTSREKERERKRARNTKTS